MSKSLDYCKTIASNPLRSSYADRNWGGAVEYTETEAIFDRQIKGNRQLEMSGTDSDGNKVRLGVELLFDEDADFDYFISDSIIHDGTLLFVQNLIDKCVAKVCCAQIYNKNIRELKSGDTIKYTVGNFVVLNEFEEQFAPDNKPWMQERTTVLLPLKMEIK